jgi:hypothetical protein
MNEFGVILFDTTSMVMQAEKVLKRAGLAVKLIPVPRQFSSDCGISIRFEWKDCDSVAAALAAARVESGPVHRF